MRTRPKRKQEQHTRKGLMRGAERFVAGAGRPDHLLCTSNYASIKSLPAHITPVGISIGIPGWYKKERELRLAPTRAMLKMQLDEYDPLYLKILYGLDPAEVYDSLTHGGTRTVAMLCWCKREYVCHRRYAAEWLEAHLGIVVPEFGVPREETETFWEWE